ncbi:hypothetical protein AVEN_239064-1 [Araneus ventricosus]|uniref:MATH domain-containing protein n=1 Tax=Araneus ventricosus TaxID=182803 RepID=A0A4Y2INX7_ARAVE|nr:hypothetical protein AVEN_239064-1 [Araneus ventricosus]
MTSNFDSSDLKQEEETAEGHYARFSFSVHHFPTIPSWQFKAVYHTPCKSLPTSWEIFFKSEKGPSNSCFVSLSRVDYIAKPVDAYTWVSFFDIHNRRLAFPKVLSKRGILPHGKVQVCIEEMIPRVERGILAQLELIVEVSLSISSCHEKIVPSVAGLNSHLNKMKLSKL